MPNRNATATLFAQMDHVRRELGGYLDGLGLGPLETPSRSVISEPCLTLKSYEPVAGGAGPLALLVPAPIKRAYLWDLAPWASVVQDLIAGGFRVYLLQWEPPGEAESGFGLADYGNRLLLACLQAIRQETGEKTVFLAGHSLGGTLAALFSALYPERVKGLVLLGAPLHFGPEIGLFGPLVASAPSARALTASLGNVPGSLVNEICLLAAPATFGWSRWIDWLGSLTNPQDLRTHLLVERWTLDELPFAQRFFEELVEFLYREDRFLQRTLVIDGKIADPQKITAPILSVVDRRCGIAPLEAVLPFHQAVQSAVTQVLWYKGDIGVSLQHVGMLVGRHAHQTLWPEIIRWMQTHSG